MVFCVEDHDCPYLGSPNQEWTQEKPVFQKKVLFKTHAINYMKEGFKKYLFFNTSNFSSLSS